MKKYFKIIRKDRLVYRLFSASFILIFLTFLFTVLSYSNLPPLLPIFNQLPWGPDRLSESLGIFIPSVLVFVIVLINAALSGYIYFNSPLLSRLFAVTSFLITLLTFLFVTRTILLIS